MNQPSHRQYLLAAASAFCRVCTDKECQRSRKEQSLCLSLVAFRDANLSILEPLMDKTGGKESKVCRKCGTEKPLSEFCKNHRYKDGHQNVCKACCNEMTKQARRQKKMESPSRETLRKARKMKELQHLLGKAAPVVTDMKERASLRYRMDDEYREARKECSKRKYYETNFYLARKYLKRHEAALAKATRELAELRESSQSLSGRELYIVKCKINTRLAKIESFKYKAELCRSILDGKVRFTKEEMEKAGIFHVKSALMERMEKG